MAVVFDVEVFLSCYADYLEHFHSLALQGAYSCYCLLTACTVSLKLCE